MAQPAITQPDGTRPPSTQPPGTQPPSTQPVGTELVGTELVGTELAPPEAQPLEPNVPATPGTGTGRAAARTGSVQSIERAFLLLEVLAENGGMAGLSQLAAEAGLPLPTIHRLVRTLVELGYLRQELNRQYVLGPKLIRLGDSSLHLLSVYTRPHLETLVRELGESVNLAMLDGDQVVYVAQAQSQLTMRMFTEVGRRVPPHCTAVGKAIMATMPPEQVREILLRTGMPQFTETTIVEPDRFDEELNRVRQQGYAIDEGEQEFGVRCVAVLVPSAPTRLGLSVSGPATRMTMQVVERAVPLLHRTAAEVAAELS